MVHSMTPQPPDPPVPAHASKDVWLSDAVREHGRVLLKISAAQVGPDASEDVVAETFATAWALRDRFDPTKASERAWLVGIALNHCHHHRRTLRRWRARASMTPHPVSTWDEDDAVARADASSSGESILQLISQLPEGQRVALLLTAVAGLEPSEIARATGKPAATVRSDLRRARLTIGPLLERRNDE